MKTLWKLAIVITLAGLSILMQGCGSAKMQQILKNPAAQPDTSASSSTKINTSAESSTSTSTQIETTSTSKTLGATAALVAIPVKDGSPSTESTSEERGNSVGNISSGLGLATLKDNWIYFNSIQEGTQDGLYKIKTDGTQNQIEKLIKK